MLFSNVTQSQSEERNPTFGPGKAECVSPFKLKSPVINPSNQVGKDVGKFAETPTRCGVFFSNDRENGTKQQRMEPLFNGMRTLRRRRLRTIVR